MKVGIQLYSVRKNMQQDPASTIRKVVEMGYKYLETANHYVDQDPVIGYGLTAAEVNEVLNSCQGQIVSGHISPLDPGDRSATEKILEQQQALGLQYLATNPHDFSSRESVLQIADFLNKLGEMCKQYGIQLLYHNHFAEFRKFGQQSAYEILMQETDPQLLKIQLDTYWAMRGGEDPIALLKQYKSRVKVIHQKDYPKGKDESLNMLVAYEKNLQEVSRLAKQDDTHWTARQKDEKALEILLAHLDTSTFVEIGTGIMDIQQIISTAQEHCGCEYIILEQDFTQMDEFDSIQLSMDHFKKYDHIEWQ